MAKATVTTAPPPTHAFQCRTTSASATHQASHGARARILASARPAVAAATRDICGPWFTRVLGSAGDPRSVVHEMSAPAS